MSSGKYQMNFEFKVDLTVHLMTTKPPLVKHVIGQMYFMMQIL